MRYSLNAQSVLAAFEMHGKRLILELSLDQIAAAFFIGACGSADIVRRIGNDCEELHAARRFLESGYCHSLRCVADRALKDGRELDLRWLIQATLEITGWARPDYVDVYLLWRTEQHDKWLRQRASYQ